MFETENERNFMKFYRHHMSMVLSILIVSSFLNVTENTVILTDNWMSAVFDAVVLGLTAIMLLIYVAIDIKANYQYHLVIPVAIINIADILAVGCVMVFVGRWFGLPDQDFMWVMYLIAIAVTFYNRNILNVMFPVQNSDKKSDQLEG